MPDRRLSRPRSIFLITGLIRKKPGSRLHDGKRRRDVPIIQLTWKGKFSICATGTNYPIRQKHRIIRRNILALHHLFREGKIGGLTLKNRVIFPPMGTMLPDEGGFISRELIDYHVARAKGGCGMNIIEVSAVHPSTKGPRTIGIYDDSFIPGLTKLAAAIRGAGGKACIQLWHAGRQTNSRVTGMPIVAPSPIPCPLCREMPAELTADQIHELAGAYGDAAVRAKQAGFDAVEVHGAHGYLIAQFMSAYSNHRQDEYGGSLENRARFALEVIRDIRRKTGPGFPVLYRLSADEYVENGLTVEETKRIVRMLEKAGIDAVHVSAGVYGSLARIIPPLDLTENPFLENAAAVKSVASIPVIAAIRFNDPVAADQSLGEGKADFVAVGRGHLADPEFCNKALAGDFDSILKCIGCNQGCVDRLFMQGLPVRCLRNPATGQERACELKQAVRKKRILVVGGGPAGLEAATTLQKRGHQVILIEKARRLGGQFFLAGAAPRKQAMADAALQMGRIAERAGVEIRLDTMFTQKLAAEMNPDEIIVATGSRPIIPDISGIDKSHVAAAPDVLEGRATTGNSVVVLGGGLIGVEVAELLCWQGKKVIVVEMLKNIAGGLGLTRKPQAVKFLADHGVTVLVNAKCLEIKDQSVIVEQNGETRTIGDIDSVVVAVGVKPDHAAEEAAKEAGYPCRVIGDARQAGRALDAIWEGAAMGREL
ncbi:MAG: FAD-dependent oxidoreductase [Deltaproteobacteria bacterium]|nr:FAD-dependent oxidoreductase [Deltaproteobacteria bacterium]